MANVNGQTCPSCGYKIGGVLERCPRCGTVVWPSCDGCKGCGLGSTCSTHKKQETK